MDSLSHVERIRVDETFPINGIAHCRTMDEYRRLYEQSIKEPGMFWSKLAEDFYWHTPLPNDVDRMFHYNFDLNKDSIRIEFMSGVRTNISYNLLDRIIERGYGDRVAYHWEGNETNERRSITYQQLKEDVCRFAAALRRQDVKCGDRVAIYLPVTIELVVAMLACARIGAIHTVVFAGFSSHSLADRMVDANCVVLITADGSFRGEKFLHISPIIDDAVKSALERNLNLKSIIVVQRFESSIQHNKSQYESTVESYRSPYERYIHYWNDLIRTDGSDDHLEPEWVDCEHPLFILYTSGSTGKPKGVVHTVGGYMLTTALVFKYAFNYVDGDVFFCTADLGWITGHTANVYGALANAATCVLFEGLPNYPFADRFWEIIDHYRVNIFYTAPTAIRALMKYDDKYVAKYSMDHLKLLALVGEPINREAWYWLFCFVGKSRCPIVDTYFQTETGAPMIFPIPGPVDLKPGSATLPFFGIVPVILDENGMEISGTESGYLAFKQAWPGIARTVDGNHPRFEETYFAKFPGYYFTGDAAFRDLDGYFWITGRTDDLLNVSGHLLSTAEVESALLNDKRISEVAAVSMPHSVKGQCICVYVVTKNGYAWNDSLAMDLRNLIRQTIGPVATPDLMLPVRGLAKTRSGKIMRRVLGKIAQGDHDFGDISTITDETIIEHLIETRNAKSN
ncbi:hypothetical protein RDWZM_010454 [Blomia tropicalis]|uniref:Acetyl-coenzyme A synthetase n=1 Tax=Blomia tropicalis TaxID=40697 RepID=A0A9Q0LYT9_BLOTA|nr:Acetyl-coenzyme A synthetase, cytoplasmic [Blomia tropicalis]KAJ6215954.1 hypothetical protein RDWZM_010454 [Blomia tropicalis]